jgi:hypothetical protein
MKPEQRGWSHSHTRDQLQAFACLMKPEACHVSEGDYAEPSQVTYCPSPLLVHGFCMQHQVISMHHSRGWTHEGSSRVLMSLNSLPLTFRSKVMIRAPTGAAASSCPNQQEYHRQSKVWIPLCKGLWATVDALYVKVYGRLRAFPV